MRKSRLLGDDKPITSHQAFAYIEPALARYNQSAKLILVVSGEDIDIEGRSTLWEFFFDFPTIHAKGNFRIELNEDENKDNLVAYFLVEEINTSSNISIYPALPIPFRDSPEVVKSFINQGVDFIAGDTSLYLSGEVMPDGKAIWKTFAYGIEYQEPFA